MSSVSSTQVSSNPPSSPKRNCLSDSVQVPGALIATNKSGSNNINSSNTDPRGHRATTAEAMVARCAGVSCCGAAAQHTPAQSPHSPHNTNCPARRSGADLYAPYATGTAAFTVIGHTLPLDVSQLGWVLLGSRSAGGVHAEFGDHHRLYGVSRMKYIVYIPC
ncbi:hypothetical protein K438DRAFT_1935460 [Mycena galopus ATCC 62051]|nr:hypothetical protein K438DRAFT_1935460 [Mycena galopus ATCC 62051]